MEQSTIAIIILLATLVLYAIPKMSLAVTSILACVAMVLTGILDLGTATGGFANKVIFLNAGLMIFGQAMVTTGLAGRVGDLIAKSSLTKTKTMFVLGILCIATIMAVFLNGAIVVSILMPIVNAVVLQSDGKIQRKDSYFVLGVGATFGNNVLTISATSMLTAVGLLVDMGYEEMNVLAPLAINLPAVIAVIVFYAIFGIKLQDKWFDFDEIPITEEAPVTAVQEDKPVWKQYVVGISFIVLVVALVSGADYGLVSLIASAFVILTGCISEKEAWKSVSWGTVIVVACSIGFSNGIKVSGAGEVIANFFINIAGPLGQSGIGMCIILFMVASLLSDLMSDNATVAIMLPIAAAIADTLGVSAIPIFMAVCSGTKVGIATPICVTPMTMIGAAGYRFKDYVRMGGLLNVICWVVSSIMIAIVYF